MTQRRKTEIIIIIIAVSCSRQNTDLTRLWIVHLSTRCYAEHGIAITLCNNWIWKGRIPLSELVGKLGWQHYALITLVHTKTFTTMRAISIHESGFDRNNWRYSLISRITYDIMLCVGMHLVAYTSLHYYSISYMRRPTITINNHARESKQMDLNAMK